MVFPIEVWCQRSKIESKSQLRCAVFVTESKWFKMSKIKDWKQITTTARAVLRTILVVQDVKDQRLKANHNINKEVTALVKVVQDVKDQRLKANHNKRGFLPPWTKSGSRCQRSKIESKSQRHTLNIGTAISGSRCQRSKIESKSQPEPYNTETIIQWFKMSKIKDWKQITTKALHTLGARAVVQDVKDQRLKANHNLIDVHTLFQAVVQDVKDQRLKANHNSW